MRLAIKTGPFLRHLLARCASEAAAKASRLAVVVVIARTMDPAAIGLAAAAMATGEIVKALTENGLVQRIVAAPDTELEGTCNTAWRLGWLWCAGLIIAQLALAAGVWWTTGSTAIALMIALLSLEYLFMPGGIVQCALAMRAQKLSAIAAIGGGQIVAANVATAALALVWPDPLAIVLPKILSAPIWLLAMRRLHPWQRSGALVPVAGFIRFGAAILGVELVKALRLHADKLVIGALLGAEALGIYFFAFNAGLGLATSFAQAFAVTLFPHLCMASDRQATFRRAVFLALGIMAPIVVLQALAAQWYVPLLFGAGWDDAAPVVAILCLAAIPGILWSAVAQLLRAEDRAGTEFRVTAFLTIALITVTAIAAPHGLMAVAIAHLVTATAIQIVASLPALGRALPATQPKEA